MLWKSSLGALGALTLLALATPAHAATTPNACRYSFDGLYRDMPVMLSSSATIVPDARYPAPTDVVPGQTLRTAAGTAGVQLPGYLASFGYAVGLLHPGRNVIPVQVWIAISATNTKERVQTVGPIAVEASTDITVDPADDNRFLGATPWVYTTPVIGALSWTAVGGDVVFAQDPGGQLGSLPVGTGGALRAVTGSAVIQASFAGGASIYMDCRPGHTTGIEFDFAGPTYAPDPAVPFDAKAGPRNATCLSALGRQVTGAAANFPDGIDRELDPMPIALSASGVAPEYTVGTPYTLSATRLAATLTSDTLATLGRFEDSGQPLVVAGRSYPLGVWVTIAASNTAEGAQTVRAAGSYTPNAGFSPIALAVDLPSTTWTPTGAGPIEFRLGLPGSASPIRIKGPATGGPGGPVDGGEYTASPYGSTVLALGTERNAALLDCAPAAFRVADASIPWSNAGRTGSAGRYAIDPNIGTPAFAIAVNSSKPPVGDPGGAPPPVPTAVPAPAVRPATPKAPAGRVASTGLTSSGGKLELKLTCPAGSSSCRGTIAVRSAKRLRLGKQAKTLTLTRAARYSIAPGKRRTVTLSLSKEGRSALKRFRTIATRVTLTTSAGVTSTRRIDLRRSR